MTMRDLQRLGQEFDAADAAALSEREAIVAWLRSHGDVEFDYAADAIERGEHLK